MAKLNFYLKKHTITSFGFNKKYHTELSRTFKKMSTPGKKIYDKFIQFHIDSIKTMKSAKNKMPSRSIMCLSDRNSTIASNLMCELAFYNSVIGNTLFIVLNASDYDYAFSDEAYCKISETRSLEDSENESYEIKIENIDDNPQPIELSKNLSLLLVNLPGLNQEDKPLSNDDIMKFKNYVQNQKDKYKTVIVNSSKRMINLTSLDNKIVKVCLDKSISPRENVLRQLYSICDENYFLYNNEKPVTTKSIDNINNLFTSFCDYTFFNLTKNMNTEFFKIINAKNIYHFKNDHLDYLDTYRPSAKVLYGYNENPKNVHASYWHNFFINFAMNRNS